MGARPRRRAGGGPGGPAGRRGRAGRAGRDRPAAERALATLGGGLARDGSVRVVRLPDRVRVVVSADAAKLLPVRLGVTGSAESLLVAPPLPDPTATPDPAATPTPAATSEPAAGTGRPAAGAP